MIREGATERFQDRNIFIHPAFNEPFRVLKEAYALSYYLPSIALVTGRAGVGKTTLSKHCESYINSQPSEYKAHRVQLKSVNSETDIIVQSARGLFGIPVKSTPAEKLDAFCSSFKNQNYKVLIIDEAQHMLTQLKGKSSQRYSDFIKVLADEGICVLLFGVEDAEKLFTTENYSLMVKGQVESRGMARCEMPIIPNLNKINGSVNPWEKTINYYLKHCQMPVDIDLTARQVLNKLFEVTNGNFRALDRIFTICHLRFESNKADSITEQLLSDVVKVNVTRNKENNPFISLSGN
ncbi:ATP-binding protein [Paraglaciecola sp. L1A13]|uniref:ATP-binding protein n=1 Tax=Paraglaciecola sp. L1A13 TaxID=2686359 RepID=UPI00131EB5BE|nr:ATP-binding protein [Paraglaciecola sp. L1A13]